MSGASKKLMGTTAAGGGALAIEDVFSTYLYTGDGSNGTSIVNNIDLAGEGGLVWRKKRTSLGTINDHTFFDTERGRTSVLFSNSTAAAVTTTNSITSFNNDGFTIVDNNSYGQNLYEETYASWTWRKAPRFFDCVTYTGNGVAGREIAHNLGVAPGMIIIKNLDNNNRWYVWHNSFANNEYLYLNESFAKNNYGLVSYLTADPTSTTITINDDTTINSSSGYNYVAYLFAHDPLGPSGDGSDGLIACGSYTGNSGNTEIDLGWEPQWVMIKRTNSAEDWLILDTMRGWVNSGDDVPSSGQKDLLANTSSAEATPSYAGVTPQANGFKVRSGLDALYSANGSTYIYIAIRRGPMRAPTSGTEVFAPITSQSATGTKQTTGFPVDMQIQKIRTQNGDNYLVSRITGVGTNEQSGEKYLITNSTAAEASASLLTRSWDNTGYETPSGWNSLSTAYFNFRRAPGFFDAVCYTGTGSARTVPHNLGVAPEMIIFKARNTADDNWFVYAAPLGPTKGLYLNATNSAITSPGVVNDTAPTESVFSTSAAAFTNINTTTYIAYLFATLPGVSKVGSYTGTGTHDDHVIDCGFTSGARFVLLKRTDAVSDWFVWDSVRGITTGADPRLSLNTTAAEYTGLDDIHPHPSGFIAANPNGSDVNALNSEWIFLAIA